MAKAVSAAQAERARDERLERLARDGDWDSYRSAVLDRYVWAWTFAAPILEPFSTHMFLHGMYDYKKRVDAEIAARNPPFETSITVRISLTPLYSNGVGIMHRLVCNARFDLLRLLTLMDARYLEYVNLPRLCASLSGARHEEEGLRFILDYPGNCAPMHRGSVETAAWDARRLKRTAIADLLDAWLARTA
jgi:hypothetical protein